MIMPEEPFLVIHIVLDELKVISLPVRNIPAFPVKLILGACGAAVGYDVIHRVIMFPEVPPSFLHLDYLMFPPVHPVS